jgi:hypothetical protein
VPWLFNRLQTCVVCNGSRAGFKAQVESSRHFDIRGVHFVVSFILMSTRVRGSRTDFTEVDALPSFDAAAALASYLLLLCHLVHAHSHRCSLPVHPSSDIRFRLLAHLKMRQLPKAAGKAASESIAVPCGTSSNIEYGMAHTRVRLALACVIAPVSFLCICSWHVKLVMSNASPSNMGPLIPLAHFKSTLRANTLQVLLGGFFCVHLMTVVTPSGPERLNIQLLCKDFFLMGFKVIYGSHQLRAPSKVGNFEMQFMGCPLKTDQDSELLRTYGSYLQLWPLIWARARTDSVCESMPPFCHSHPMKGSHRCSLFSWIAEGVRQLAIQEQKGSLALA